VLAAVLIGLRPDAPVCRPDLPPRAPAPADEVYCYAATATADEIRLEFVIDDGGYLYREDFEFASADPAVVLSAPQFPAGEMHTDEFFGAQEIYRHQFAMAIPYTRSAAVGEFVLEMTLRGCDENVGICYPYQDWTATVLLPDDAPIAAGVAAAGGAAATGSAASPGSGVGAPPGANAANSGLSGSAFAGPASNQALPVDQVFIPNARFDTANELTVGWQIEPGYYLYRDWFSFEVAGEIQFGPPKLPTGTPVTDLTFGESEVYYNYVETVVPFNRAHPNEQQLAITLGFRGCKDDSICYPPAEQRIEVILPASAELPASTSPPPVASPPVPRSEQGRFADLITGGSWLALLGAFYVAGLALSLTPCVLPMVPILSSIVAGQGRQVSAGRGLALSVAYVLGMALTYTIAGALTALAGAQVQAIFQKPWIIATFASLFVVMALGMFGLFEIQMPAAVQTRLAALANRQRGGSFYGTAIVGALSALIVTTCVAPPLIGALAVIGQTGDVPRGALALFVLAIGMGTPLLLVGASAGKLLPRVGPWMNTVKAGFGVMMIGLAIWMLERVLPGSVILVLWALLVFLTGVFLGAFDALQQDPRPVRRLAKGLGVLACLYGAILLIGATLGGENPLRPIPRLGSGLAAQPAAAGPDFIDLGSVAQLNTLLAEARAGGRPVFVDFTANWCSSCKEMEAYTFPDAGVVAALEPCRVLRAVVTENDENDKALLNYFGSFGPPTMAFFDSRGARLSDDWWHYSYVPADEFIEHVSAVAAL
jgi:thiol:disulfide interchange protein DsbD